MSDRCDVCDSSGPPRNPYWRDNTTKTCDPCEARINERVAALAAERTAAVPLDRADLIRRCDELAARVQRMGEINDEFARRLAAVPSVDVESLSVALHEAGVGCSPEPCDVRTEFYEGIARTMHDTDARDILARLSPEADNGE